MTDEQRMREEFESRHIGPTNPDREWYLERLKNGEYRSGYTETKWREWRAAYMARDAEVQALRKALGRIERLYDSPDPDDAAVLREAMDIARAALAGGCRGTA